MLKIFGYLGIVIATVGFWPIILIAKAADTMDDDVLHAGAVVFGGVLTMVWLGLFVWATLGLLPLPQ